MKVIQSGAWKDATPKGVLQGGVWKTPAKVSVLKDGAWVSVWPPAIDIPPYLYDAQVVKVPDYTVEITALDGWPEGDPNEFYHFTCTTITGLNGYVPRKFTKQFGLSGYSSFACSLQDVSGIPGKELKTITFNVQVGP
jgi:hypothetical protein